MSEISKTTVERPENLPDEVYRITDDDPPACSNTEDHDGYSADDAVWRVDMRDSKGDIFAAVCNDEKCIEKFAEYIEEQRAKKNTTVVESENA